MTRVSPFVKRVQQRFWEEEDQLTWKAVITAVVLNKDKAVAVAAIIENAKAVTRSMDVPMQQGDWKL